MAKKKEETVEETKEVSEATEEKAVDEKAEKPKKKAKAPAKKTTKKKAEKEESSVVENILDAASDVVETVAETAVDAVEAVIEGASDLVDAVVGDDSTDGDKKTRRKRAEKIGVVFSDKMTKTVTVRVDRQVKHKMYHKYIKRKKKFMAHDELGATIGDKVRIVETRPLSAKKRWRVVEIIQKAEK